jgi:outer membrane protein OmpA-like peptidoglycan-associated protein
MHHKDGIATPAAFLRSRGITLCAAIIGVLVAPLAAAFFHPALGAPQETDLPGVTADIAYLRQYDGVLHVGVLLHNPANKQVAAHLALDFGQVVVIDPKANKKHFALKDANGHFLAGPISDWNGGGRWFPKLEAQSDTVVWMLFDAVQSGSAINVEGPLFHSMNNLAVVDGAPSNGQQVASSVPPLQASILSADRAQGQLKVRLKIVNPGKKQITSHTVSYRDVYALDPRGKRSYPLLKDNQGLFIVSPIADKNDGGRWFLSHVRPNVQAFVDLTFQAPPDSVRSVDIVFPWFAPFEAVAIRGEGGAAASGVAVAGRSTDLQRALKDLNAEETPQEVKVNLSADLLFDFDKADIKPAAEPELQKVVTVLRSYPKARVLIEGHTDGKGSETYNQTLSERRAATVAQWLAGHAGLDGSNIKTRGWGKTKPIAPNTKPNGADDPEGRAKNRRVEITVTKS